MRTPQTETLELTRVPIAETGMLIRKPVAQVFEAMVNPETKAR
jgi:uncharacterized protein YndB with AHSA1/START domain